MTMKVKMILILKMISVLKMIIIRMEILMIILTTRALKLRLALMKYAEIKAVLSKGYRNPYTRCANIQG